MAPLTKTDPELLISEVEEAVKKMILGTAARLDGVHGELIRDSGNGTAR